MKTLSEFIKEQEKFDYISEDLYRLCESRNLCYKDDYWRKIILEGSGVFKGCFELSDYISLNIQNLFDKENKIELNYTKQDFDNIKYEDFFDILFINVKKINKSYEDFKGDSEYKPEEPNILWDNINKRFGILTINLSLPFDSFDHQESCADLIEHELNHAYQDYCRRQEDGKSMYNDKLSQNKFTKNLPKNEKTIIKNYMKKEECNSYVAQIEGELGNQKFDNYKKIIEWLDKNSNAWGTYKTLRDTCEKQGGKLYNLFCKNWGKFINHLSFVLEKHLKNISKISEHASREFILDEYKKFRPWYFKFI